MPRPGSKLLLVAALAALPLAGCSTSPPPAPAPVAQAPAPPPVSATDTAFFDQASRSGIEEVTFGQLARQHAARASTRDFAMRMVDVHTPANQQLTQLAATKGVTPPTTMDDTHQSLYDSLGKLRGRGFDRTYLNGQATDHAATLQLFQNEAQNGTDPDVKAFAARMAPTIQSHLVMAKKLGGRVMAPMNTQALPGPASE